MEKLIIGKEYYLDSTKTEKGIFKGRDKSGIYFEPTTDTYYILENDEKHEFNGCVGFFSKGSATPV